MKALHQKNDDIEIRLLLEGIFLKYGYDFRNYSKESLKRRLRRRLIMSGLKNISQIQERALHDIPFFKSLLMDFSINVTELYRDPHFFRTLRERVLPVMRELPFLRIWHAGCASGEEVYSMAIMLEEEGLYDKSLIYATDFNPLILNRAREGMFPIEIAEKYEDNYLKAGGAFALQRYYRVNGGSAVFNPSLKRNIVFAEHNLATDSIFSQMKLIVCRNVLIYFDKKLKNRVLNLFRESLDERGVLCLGSKETTRFSESEKEFIEFDGKFKIFRKREEELSERYWWPTPKI